MGQEGASGWLAGPRKGGALFAFDASTARIRMRRERLAQLVRPAVRVRAPQPSSRRAPPAPK